MRAVALLSWWQLRNSVRSIFTDPKKLLPFVVIAAVLGFNLWLTSSGPGRPQSPDPGLVGFVVRHAAATHAALFAAFAVGALVTIGAGFSGKALVFSPADVDYLFPSPVPRRVVLAYKLPALAAKHALSAVALLYAFYILVWQHLPGGVTTAEALFLLLGGTLWLALYTNLAAAAEVAFGLGKAAVASRVIQVALVALAAWAAALVWRDGFAGIAALERNAVFATLFYPCRLLADIVLAPITRGAMGGAVGQLAALFAASLALVLALRGNFYEATLDASDRAARVRQAAKEGNALAAWSVARAGRGGATRDFSRPYALAPFGTGGAALFWAHLAALAKHPLMNFAAPFGLALAIATALVFWRPGTAGATVPAMTGYFLFMSAMVARQSKFLAAVQRLPLVRPLPVAPWKVAAAEVGAAALPGTLAAWGAGLPLLVGNASPFVAGHLLLTAPLLFTCVLLIAYACAFWYPDGSDRAGQLIASLVLFALVGGLAVALAPFIIVPLLFRVPFLMLVTVPVAAAGAGVALLVLAGRAFAHGER